MTPEAKAREIDNALAIYDSVASSLGGCSDGYCVIKGRVNGQHTNGGCRCLSYPADITPFTLKKLAIAARMMRDAIPAALRDVERETLERAAQVAETCRDEFLSPQYATPQPIGSVAERFACSKVAEAIRSLIKEPTSGGQP